MIAQVRDSARAFVRAEVDYILAELGVRTSKIVPAVAMALSAAVLLCSALTALLIGLIFALIPYLTVWGALGLVIGAAILIAFILVQQSLRLVKMARLPRDEL